MSGGGWAGSGGRESNGSNIITHWTVMKKRKGSSEQDSFLLSADEEGKTLMELLAMIDDSDCSTGRLGAVVVGG